MINKKKLKRSHSSSINSRSRFKHSKTTMIVRIQMRVKSVLYINIVAVLTKLIASCPTNCSCSTYGYVQCLSLDLTTFPSQLPSSTKSLFLSYNRIPALTVHDVMGLSSVETLYLDYNRLQRVDGQVLCMMPLLKRLVLDNTNISYLAPHLPAYID